MAATACAANDALTVIAAGLSVVPPRSRLARSVGLGLDLARRAVPYDDAIDELYAAHDGLHWVHVLNNAAGVAFALACGGGDFSPAVCALVARGAALPRPGETVMARSLATIVGGKGANQAIAAARAGARCAIIAAVGDDLYADAIRATLREAGVDTSALRTVPGPSGTALIVVDDDGQN